MHAQGKHTGSYTSTVSCQILVSDIWTSSLLTARWREIHHTNEDTLSLESRFQTHPCKGGRTMPGGQIHNCDITELVVSAWGHWPQSLKRSYSGSTILPPYTHQH